MAVVKHNTTQHTKYTKGIKTMNTNTNTTATANLFTLIKEKKTKWGISLDRNDKTLSNSGFAFSPFEETTKTPLSLFSAATALPNSKGEYETIANNKKLNALRACFFACEAALRYNGRTTDKVAAVLEMESVKKAITATDEAELHFFTARCIYTTSKKQFETRLAVTPMVSKEWQENYAKNAIEQIANAKKEMEQMREIYTTAKKNEDKLNWEIIRAYFPWFINNK